VPVRCPPAEAGWVRAPQGMREFAATCPRRE